ncbi:hypothetical protein CXX84_03630 [Arthrobacter sp. AFG7.2]|nr:hypothetical protein CXX84_03630 [Arthrobacter sp. AFG7.2]
MLAVTTDQHIRIGLFEDRSHAARQAFRISAVIVRKTYYIGIGNLQLMEDPQTYISHGRNPAKGNSMYSNDRIVSGVRFGLNVVHAS